ncbi:MAG: hypothetical protein ACI8SE_000955 [Bacteroidia bacterium]|jgi:hypothetical protein
MKAIKVVLLFVLPFICNSAFGQSSADVSRTLQWNFSLHGSQENFQSQLSFKKCYYNQIGEVAVPVYFERIAVQNANTSVSLSNIKYSDKTIDNDVIENLLTANVELKQYISYQQGRPILNIEFVPAIKNISGSISVIQSFNLFFSTLTSQNKLSHKKASIFKSQSALSQGEWHKFKITSEGIYKITGSQLASAGIDVANISAKTIKIFGFEGGPLSEAIPDYRSDDLEQFGIDLVDNNGNNRIDADDFIRFYAQAAHAWKLANGQYVHLQNVYSNNAYVFLTHGGSDAKKLGLSVHGQGNSFDQSLDYFYDLVHHEKEEVNFIQSGRHWYGDEFRVQKIRTFDHSFSDVKTQYPARLSHRFVGRSIGSSGSCGLFVNGSSWDNMFFGAVSGDYDDTFGRIANKSNIFTMTGNSVSLRYEYNLPSGEGNAWIDYYTLSVPVGLQLTGNQKIVRSKEAADYASARYQFTGSAYSIWNITDVFNPTLQQTFDEGGKRNVITATGKEAVNYALFKSGEELSPEFVETVVNQNMHQTSDVDFIIITHPDFLDESVRLADFHRKEYNQKVIVANIRDIYNEFSGGRQDPVGIREFIRMHYTRGLTSNKPLDNVLLMGDGSYDFQNRVELNTNYIPTFQGRNTTDPVNSYSSDDFYAILDDAEGYYDLTLAAEDLDIGIGRIPCNSLNQAKIMVDKIVRYHDPSTFGDWQNRLTYLGDDEDGSIHLDDSEMMSNFVRNQEPVFNINKIYLDAYEQKSFGSGEKYPDVNIAISKTLEKGTLTFNYIGHGGPSGMAHERVVTRDEIRSWTNYNKLPLMVTATCELSRFDDPAQDSPGELMLFNANGGAVGLVTTMRLVQISLNTRISVQVWDNNIVALSNGPKQLGIFFRDTKNETQRAVNQRNFSLLGDPAMTLSFPKYNVVSTKINDSIIGNQSIDSLKAFSRIKVDGEVRTPSGDLASDFNGFVYPTIYDKFLGFESLGNDPESYVRKYQLQNSVLHRGKVSVINGEFSFQFVVPKDISYNFGKGKISYFAENGVIDAHGYDTSITVGGSITEIADDKKGPEIELYLNDKSWVFGGTTNPTPLLLCSVFDENGINTVGNGIGRDITAVIDAGTEDEQIIVLNDFYQSKLDSYQEGEIEYRMESIAPGRHTLKIRVWDVYNNVSEDETEFVVAEDAELALHNVINFPNPFTTSTVFHFDHNKTGLQMDVLLQVITPTGRIVKTFNQSTVSANSHFDAISWNGKDDFGDQLARGVYLYKLSVKTEDGNKAEVTQKLVILK